MNTPKTENQKPKTVLIAAMAQNRCIGINNQMPWHIPEDFKHFKAKTLGKPCIMGRKTFESIVEHLGKPLPGRTSIIISRSGFAHEGAISASSIEDAIEKAREIAKDTDQDEICIVGGAQIYTQSLPHATHMELTLVHKDVKGDAFFPEFDKKEWPETARTDHDGDLPFSFVTLEKQST